MAVASAGPYANNLRIAHGRYRLREQGMRYLHRSPLRTHGRLKSSNCLIDHQWSLKLSDYGLGQYRNRLATNLSDSQRFTDNERFTGIPSVAYRVRGVDGSCARHLTVESYTVVMLLTFILIIISISSPLALSFQA